MTFSIYTCIGVVVSFYLVTIVAELVAGIPRPGGGGWQQAQVKYGPFGLSVSVAHGIFGIISDFVILLIPLTQIISLCLPLRKKIILIFDRPTVCLIQYSSNPDHFEIEISRNVLHVEQCLLTTTQPVCVPFSLAFSESGHCMT